MWMFLGVFNIVKLVSGGMLIWYRKGIGVRGEGGEQKGAVAPQNNLNLEKLGNFFENMENLNSWVG